MLIRVKCNLCGSDACRLLYQVHPDRDLAASEGYKITDHKAGLPVKIAKCRRCGLIYANPRPAGKSLLANYINMVDESYLAEERGRRLSALPILKALKKFRKMGRLLDIGCATGFLLDEAKRLGWEVYGVELSGWAVDYAKNKLGMENIFQGTLKSSLYPDNYFDAVILKDTIEHLLNPKEALIEIRRILKPSGLLCVNTPNIDSLLSRLLRAKWWGVKQSHLYYFTPKTLSKLLEATGFAVIKKRSHARIFSAKYWIEKLGSYNSTLQKIFIFICKWAFASEKLICVNLGDQIEVFARKSRKLRYLEELEVSGRTIEQKESKVTVVLPAYNAAQTLRRTLNDIPKEFVNEIILVDDASRDNTFEIAKKSGLVVFAHEKNRGYGANQKTCYARALERGADIIVMVHPDYQYDPRVIPELIGPIKKGLADAVFGSRMMKGGALEGGMPLWKHSANIILTAMENVALGTYLTEYHSGFRAYSAKYLKSVNFILNSDGFIFDTEIIVQGLLKYMRIEEIPIRTRYFQEASSIKLWPSLVYGFLIVWTLIKYFLHTKGVIRFRQFD